MRKLVWLVWPLLLALAGFACDEDPAGPADDPPPGIVGTVLDADGVPMAGAPVGFIYGVPGFPAWGGWPPEDYPDEEACDLGSIGYVFSVDSPSTVSLTILDHRGQRVRELIDPRELPAGTHQVSWLRVDDAGALVPNGAYRAHIEIRRSGFEEVLDSDLRLLNALSIDYADCLGAAAITDLDGHFRIPYADLPIGASVSGAMSEQPRVVPDSLWIQAAVPGARGRRLLHLSDLLVDQEFVLTLEPAP